MTTARERSRRKRALERQLSPAALRQLARRPELLDFTAATRTMSFLACRIRSFDAIAGSLAVDPAALMRLSRCAMTPLIQAVLERRGTIDRMMPDGFTAFFNAPLDDADHAVHACECALSMMQVLEKVNRALEHALSADGVALGPVGIGIGVTTGLAVVGDFGTDSVPNYCAAGRAAELAGEIEQLSANYGAAILVGEATRAMAESKFAFLEVDIVGSKSGERTPLFALLGTPVSRANPKFLALKESHERAFEAYRGREWEKARALITQCRTLSGANSMLYELYLERIDHLASHPPDRDWNGVFNTPIVR